MRKEIQGKTKSTSTSISHGYWQRQNFNDGRVNFVSLSARIPEFSFFVNSTNIINKTRDNFLNDTSIKYLFNKFISFGDKKINIQEVDNFQITDSANINICFSTIQGLHSRLNNPQENSLTYEDFQDQKIVLISDEAHHINVETKTGVQLSKEEGEEIASWENTVNRIFNANPDNVLLEFTATVDFNNPNI